MPCILPQHLPCAPWTFLRERLANSGCPHLLANRVGKCFSPQGLYGTQHLICHAFTPVAVLVLSPSPLFQPTGGSACSLPVVCRCASSAGRRGLIADELHANGLLLPELLDTQHPPQFSPDRNHALLMMDLDPSPLNHTFVCCLANETFVCVFFVFQTKPSPTILCGGDPLLQDPGCLVTPETKMMSGVNWGCG